MTPASSLQTTSAVCMAFSELERQRNAAAIDWFLQRRRPPEHIRPQLDIGCTIAGHVVDVFEIRPDWRDKSTLRHTPVARIRFVRSKGEWRLYWMRGDLKWHAYEPSAVHRTLRDALAAVDADKYGCFFG